MKTILLNSGGKDSLAVARLLHETHELHSCYIDMRIPENVRGAPAAAAIASRYCASHHIVQVSSGPYLSPTTNLMPGWNYTTVPFKLITTFSLGAMYGVTIGAKAIASGVRCDIFPEDVSERLRAMLDLSVRVRDSLEVIAPLNSHKGKQGELEDVIFDLIKDDPLWKETSYCNEEPPCGACYGCRVRQEWLSRG